MAESRSASTEETDCESAWHCAHREWRCSHRRRQPGTASAGCDKEKANLDADLNEAWITENRIHAHSTPTPRGYLSSWRVAYLNDYAEFSRDCRPHLLAWQIVDKHGNEDRVVIRVTRRHRRGDHSGRSRWVVALAQGGLDMSRPL